MNRFELINVGVEGMDMFMKERTKIYAEVAKKMGLGNEWPQQEAHCAEGSV